MNRKLVLRHRAAVTRTTAPPAGQRGEQLIEPERPALISELPPAVFNIRLFLHVYHITLNQCQHCMFPVTVLCCVVGFLGKTEVYYLQTGCYLSSANE